MMGFSKCLGFVHRTVAEHFIQKNKTSSGLPNKFVSGERWPEKSMGVKKEFTEYFPPFSQSLSALVGGRGICTWRGSLKEIEKAFTHLQSEIE